MTLLRRAIDWTLERLELSPGIAARTATSIERCVLAIETTVWPGAAPCFSGLNADGCPIEFAFSSRDAAVRFTSEAAPPETGAADRLDRARQWLDAAGASLPPAVVDAILQWQAEGPLAWGAAVSGRHDTRGDRGKLYAEIPPARDGVADRDIARARMRHPPRLVMIGFEPHAATFERYFRATAIEPEAVSRMLDTIGLADRARELLNAVEVAWNGSARSALGDRWGLSLAGPLDGAPDALSLFKEANRLFGGDAWTRARLIDLTRSLGAGRLNGYERVSGPLALSSGRGAHGILSFTVARGRPLELRVGLSPAAVFREAQRGAAA